MPALDDALAALSPDQRRLLQRWLRDLPPSDLGGDSAAPAPDAPRPGADPEAAAPLSFDQQQLWFLAQWDAASTAYTFPITLRLHGPCHGPSLATALNLLLQRHSALRTVFRAHDGVPAQFVRPHVPRPLPALDLAALPAARRESLIPALLRAALAQPFDLAHGPLLRAALVRLAPADHVLILTIHHIVFDNWSQGIFLRELRAAYAAAAAGRTLALPDLPLHYADYARWQRERLSGALCDAQLAYWTAQLRDAPELLALPTDHPRPPVRSVQGTTYRFSLPAALHDRLLQQGRPHGLTLFMLLLAGYAALLSRLCGQTDLVIGSSVAGRGRAELEGLVGMFVNRLALRIDLRGDPPVQELWRRVRATCLDAYAHQDVAFEQVLDALGLRRDLSRHPLFQTLLVLQSAALPGWDGAGLRGAPLEAPRDTAQFDLGLFVRLEAGALHVRVKYRTDLFDAPTIQRLGGQWARVLAGMAADPDRPLAALELLSAAERQQLLVEWNATATPERGAGDLAGRLLVMAGRTPDAVAVSDAGRQLSYGALAARAQQLARYLRRLGVGPEARVGVGLERTAELLVALLGVLAAGGAYVPLDLRQPAARLAFMLADSQVRALVTHVAVGAAPWFAGPWPVVDLARDWPAITQECAAASRAVAHPANLAYVIYTSGSTGQPKGVQVRRGGVLNLLDALAAQLEISAGDRLLALTTLGFDIAGLELYLPLLAGAHVTIGTADLARDGGRIAATLAAERITALQATPASWRLLRAAGWAGQVGLRLLSGGEALTSDLAQDLAGRGRALWNLYGPTETTIWSSAQRVAAGAARGAQAGDPTPIGRPLANTTLYVLDRAGRPAPLGVAGELYIGGAGLARGYQRRPDLTAAAFVPNPFAETTNAAVETESVETHYLASLRPHARLYRTGDLARWRADGTLSYLGRRDGQIKLRGYRIELGEVEAALAAHPDVRACAVLLRDDRLVAYVVTSNELRVTSSSDASHVADSTKDEESPPALVTRHAALAAGLRAYLAGRLPEYMLPSAYVALADLPLTASGKADRRALAARALEAKATPGAEAGPRTPTEELVAGIWRALLGVGAVGAGDDFFALGGHSLLATQALARLRATFGVDLELRALFEAPTLGELARRIDAARGRGGRPAAPVLTRQPRGADPPLSFAQERLWFLDQWDPGSAAYNVPWPMRMAGRLDLRALHAGLGAVVQRHESLRTTFPAVDGQPVQQIAPRLALRLPLIDLQALPGATREPAARRLLTEAARESFDLAAGPLVRALLLRMGAAEHAFLLTMHHIICDGWSMTVFMQELAAFYRAAALGRPADPPDLAVQYADFAIWQRAWLQGAVLDAQLAYWRGQLGDRVPVLDLPTDRPRPPVQTHRGAREPFSIADATLAALPALCQEEGATRFMVLLAAFSLLLARYSGQNEIVVGSPIAGRNLVELEGLIGYFTNTLMLRADLKNPSSFRALLRQVRDTTLDAHTHQDVPFEQLVEQLQPARDFSRPALFQVMLVLHNTPPLAYDLPDLTMRPISVETGTAKFDLLLSLGETPQGLSGAIEYNTDLFDATTIRRMARQFQLLLRHAVADPARHGMDLPLLSAAERQQALVEWSQTMAASAAAPVERQIAAQAARAPDAVALTFAAPPPADRALASFGADLAAPVHLTYGALDARANQLAHHLRALGVGPDARVGLHMARAPELVIALLGVLKAGSAYLPLDPAHPAARIRFLLADSQAHILVTNDEPHTTTAAPSRSPNDDRPAAALVLAPSSVVDLRADWPAIAQQPATPPPSCAQPDHLAYVIYTSGSTGSPKGALVTRRGLANHCRAAVARYHLGPADRTLQLAPLSFDLAVEEIVPPLAAGAALTLWPPAAPAGPDEVRALAQRARLSVLDLPTALWRAWAADPAALAPPTPRDLRLVIVGGERAPTGAYAAWRRALPSQVGWVNSYGPTEATIVATLDAPDAAADPPAGVGMPIGRPIAGMAAYVLDRRMQPVALGAAGELYLGGAGLARGYLRRPDLTAERFVPNPFGRMNDEDRTMNEPLSSFIVQRSSFIARLYRTGDVARWRADGRLDYLGRTDDQVKLRGYRVAPGEVEHALAQHPSVRACAVVVRADAAGEPRLVAYMVQESAVRGQASADPRALIPAVRGYLADRLPAYMLPAAFVALDALPLTPHGKLDRSALPAPDAAPADGYRAPRNARERQLAALWEATLGVRPIGVTTSFFDLGGHSLLAVRLLAQLRAQTGRRLPLATLFRHPTIAALAQALGAPDRPDAAGVLVAMQPGGARRPLFCVHPLGGNVLCYAALARALGPDQPVYGIQAPGLAEDAATPATVAELAAAYVTAIQQVPAAGPYLLCGWSVGGLIALEVAQQLRGQGRAVGLLALLDSHATRRRGPDPSAAELLAGLAEQLGLAVVAADLARRDAAAQLRYVVDQAAVAGVALEVEDLARLYAVYRATAQALLGYAPRAYAGRVTLFRAAGAVGPDPAEGWAGLAQGGVVVYDVPGDHATMLQDPHVAELAAGLAAAIAQADGDGAP